MSDIKTSDEELQEIDAFMLSQGFVMYPGDPAEMRLLWKVRWYFPGGQTYTDGSKGNMCVDVERGRFWYQLIKSRDQQIALAARIDERSMSPHESDCRINRAYEFRDETLECSCVNRTRLAALKSKQSKEL